MDTLDNLLESQDFNKIASNSDQIGASFSPDDLLTFAIQIKILNQLEVAASVLEALVRYHPYHASAHYELAEIYRNLKRLPDALSHAEHAATLIGDSLPFGLLYAQMLYANGCFPEGDAALSRISASTEEWRLKIRAMRDFGKLLQEYPAGKARYISRKLTEKYDWLQPAGVASRIQDAITRKIPFALIRLGDGDGAHFRVNNEDEAKFINLHKLTRKQHTEFLLGEGVDPVFTGYTAMTSTLADFVFEADIVGAPYPSWVQHEYEIASPVTINCLMNVNRRLYHSEKIKGLALCDQLIHIQLHDQNLLDPLLKSVKSATVISCIEGLPNKVREMFGIEDVDMIQIPSETYAPHLYGQKKLNVSLHYPHAFWPTVQKLSVPHEGRVFLIAAGTFGKYYAAIIKRHGGIALDLGSLVDGWMKMVSRPGYERFAQ